MGQYDPMATPQIQLRLFAPAEDDWERSETTDLNRGVTLTQFFSQWFVPIYCGSRRRPVKPATVREYTTAVARWCELLGDLPLQSITSGDCRLFVERDLASPGRNARPLSRYTAAKHCMALTTIFRQAGPRSRTAPDAASDDGLFGLDRHGRPRETPWFPPIVNAG